ncbi:hypothetical protein [Chitinophaga silvisoli]|uniref:Uncharacterized protein n=1 Tax=Chitinophaga silvisoli TaxID=2291814 RepID=A0A3E1P8G4_9BACT|nr:hypothetical protein [Chitinophaga silvisoli]RFM36444.1 hypothetical protein DXN04_02775 [Chitinophaga silvisoli]
MIKLYIGYILAAVFNFYVIMLYYGVSTGFANYAPVAALLGALVLFSGAAPIILYKTRVGLIVGIIGCLLILPFSIMFLKSIFEDEIFNWRLLLITLPSILVFTSIYFTTKSLFNKNGLLPDIQANKLIKLLLFFTPILLLILYLIFYGQYWHWNMFRM